MADTSVPDAVRNLAAGLRARLGLSGVGVHTIDGPWLDHEAIVLGAVDAPQAWATMEAPGTDEAAVLNGYCYAQRAGNADDAADTLRDRVGVIFGELAQQLRDDPTLGGAVLAPADAPLLSEVRWQGWWADYEGTSVTRVRVDWAATWTVGVA